MTETPTELAETIADIFNHLGWIWGLEQAGIPEHVPDENEIADKLKELIDKDAGREQHILEVLGEPPQLSIVSGARIVLAFNNPPPYDKHIRVLLHIGELPLETA